MRAFLLILLSALSFTANANTYTDTWWAPEEPGWGISLVHENSQIQFFMYVYDDDRLPRWYISPLTKDPLFRPAMFVGELHETRGTPYHLPRNPSDASSRALGRVTFVPHPDGSATVDYTIDNRRFIKHVRRFTTQVDMLKGLHFASLLPGYDSCDAGFSGLAVFEKGTLQIDRCPSAPCTGGTGADGEVIPMTMSLDDGATPICSFEGEFRRYGRSGAFTGAYSCRDGGAGSIDMKDIEFSSVGFNARFTATHPRCEVFKGILSGVRASSR